MNVYYHFPEEINLDVVRREHNDHDQIESRGTHVPRIPGNGTCESPGFSDEEPHRGESRIWTGCLHPRTVYTVSEGSPRRSATHMYLYVYVYLYK